MHRWQLWWRTGWLILRRSPTDKLARRALLALLALLLWVLTEALLIWRNYRDNGGEGLLGYPILGVPGIAVAWWIARRNRRADEDFPHLLKPEPAPAWVDLDLRRHSALLADEVLRTAALIDRASVEAAFAMKVELRGPQESHRQRTLAALRSTASRGEPSIQLWDTLSRDEQDLLICSEGGWPTDIVWSTLARVEDVRTLRWLLRLDDVLTPFAFWRQEFTSAVEITANPNLLAEASSRQPPEIRVEQNEAQAMLLQCVNEGLVRGIYPAEDEDERMAIRRAVELRNDTLYDRDASSEEDSSLCGLANAAFRRNFVLSRVVTYLYESEPARFVLPAISLAEEPGETMNI